MQQRRVVGQIQWVDDLKDDPIQPTSDGHKANLDAMDMGIGGPVFDPCLVKRFGQAPEVENLAVAVSPHFMWYDFAQIHKSLPVTPAMETGLADHEWPMEEISVLSS